MIDKKEVVEYKKIKSWKCPNCNRETITYDEIKGILCGCGEYFMEVK